MRLLRAITLFRVLAFCFAAPLLAALAGDTDKADVDVLIRWLLDEERDLTGIRFADVVYATAGVRVLPVDTDDAADTEVVAALGAAMDRILVEFADTAHAVHRIPRINEVSGAIEDRMQEILDAKPAFSCVFPPTAEGRVQRAGYPDLRLEHLASGKIYYVDPKLHRKGSERSGFRTFYFEPRTRTNKILEDAAHIIVGVSHTGREGDAWTFAKWNLIDLHEFEVRLKAEFQASNRDIYREDAVLAESGPSADD
ncbi:MAG: hypothetical protein JJU00_14440 [Opitutales bacterium]|nr:hypothetical protein [Opitutales bacterium]